VGEVCRAQSERDGRLYVATVVAVLPDGSVRVQFKHQPHLQTCTSGQLRSLTQPAREAQQLYVPKARREGGSSERGNEA
jgi:hypothetical protein